MQITRVTVTIQAICKQHCKQHNILLCMQDTRVTSQYTYKLATRVASQLQATQCSYYACWLQGLKVNCKQHNICIQVTRVTSQLQVTQ